MFHGEPMIVATVQLVIETQTIIADVKYIHPKSITIELIKVLLTHTQQTQSTYLFERISIFQKKSIQKLLQKKFQVGPRLYSKHQW
jgi:hypothetical protein